MIDNEEYTSFSFSSHSFYSYIYSLPSSSSPSSLTTPYYHEKFLGTHEENVIKEMYMDQQGGQRLVTCLVYLNHVEAGGYTRFPILDRNIAPAVGKLLIFHNTFENSTMLHPHSLHEGSPVVKGEKYAFNLWFRESRARR